MAKSGQIPVAANVLGTIGTVMWCVQLIPQIWHNWRYKQTEGFPAMMMLLWVSSAVPFGVYMILQDVNIPLQIQPQLFGFFTIISLGQVLHYSHQYSRIKAVITVVGLCVLCGGIEALLILTLRIPRDQRITWPILLVGIIATILLALGLLPPYFELWKRDGRVIGFNWVFLGVDCLGAVFSLLALAAQGTFDILGGLLYICVIILEIGIFASHIIWRLRHRKLLRAAKEAGKTVDEMLELEKEQGQRTSDNKTITLTTQPVDLES